MSVPLTAADFLAAGDITGLLAWRRDQHADFRMEADEDTGDSTDESTDDGADSSEDLDEDALADLADADSETDEGDLGFPANTKVEDMDADQKAAYWKNESKKANKRLAAALKGKTAKPAGKAAPKAPDTKTKATDDPFRVAYIAKERANALDAAVKAAVKPEMAKVVLDALRPKAGQISFDVATLTADTAKASALVEAYLKDLPALKASTAPKLPGTTNGGQGTGTATGAPRSLREVLAARAAAGK